MIHAVIALLLLAATPAGMAPLPAQYMSEGTFNSPDGWFALHTPNGSEWFEMRKFDGDADPRWPDGAHPSVAWFVRNPKMPGSLLVMERYSPGAPMLDASYLDGLEGDVRKAARADEPMSDFSAEVITTPVEGIRYSYRKKRSGTDRYEFWYVTGWEHKVFIQATAATREEPKWLRGVIQSFRWIKVP
jgi:hypothetical protein